MNTFVQLETRLRKGKVVAHSQPYLHGHRKLGCTPRERILTVAAVIVYGILQLRVPGPIGSLTTFIVAVGQAVRCGGFTPDCGGKFRRVSLKRVSRVPLDLPYSSGKPLWLCLVFSPPFISHLRKWPYRNLVTMRYGLKPTTYHLCPFYIEHDPRLITLHERGG